jgi:hypothetical protein
MDINFQSSAIRKNKRARRHAVSNRESRRRQDFLELRNIGHRYDDVNVLVLARLGPKKRIDAPATVEPNRNTGALE